MLHPSARKRFRAWTGCYLLAADAAGDNTSEAVGSDGSDAGEATGDGAFRIELPVGDRAGDAGAFEFLWLHAARPARRISPGIHSCARWRWR